MQFPNTVISITNFLFLTGSLHNNFLCNWSMIHDVGALSCAEAPSVDGGRLLQWMGEGDRTQKIKKNRGSMGDSRKGEKYSFSLPIAPPPPPHMLSFLFSSGSLCFLFTSSHFPAHREAFVEAKIRCGCLRDTCTSLCMTPTCTGKTCTCIPVKATALNLSTTANFKTSSNFW